MKKLIRALNRWRKSWTMNWNLALVIVGGVQQTQAEWLPWLESVLTKERIGLVLAAIGIVGFVLRFKTTKPLAEK